MADTPNASEFSTVRGFGGHVVEVQLFSFSRFINFHDVTAEMKKLGYQPAESDEAWSFTKCNPDLVIQFSVVADHGLGLPGDGASVVYYDPATDKFRQRNVFHEFVFGTDYRFLGKKAG